MLLVAAAAGEAADDHGDTRLTATLVERYGVSQVGELEALSDVDVFRLDLQGRAEVEMRSSGQLDTRGTLYDSDGGVIAEDDDAGTDMNFRIVTALPGGVYYVAVASDVDIGGYKMTARIRRAGDDHGDTSGASTFLPLGIRTTGRISPAGDTDTFRLEVPNAGSLRVGSSGPADTVGELRDTTGAVLTVRDDGGHGRNFRIERHVEPGIYYVHVSAATTGSFTLLADVSPSDDPQAAARQTFNATIYPTIVQAKCVGCHVSGGEADATRLVFVTSAASGHRATNFERMRAFVAGSDDRATLVLDKVRGLADHGGGEQIADGSPEYADLERFLTLLAANSAPIPDQTLMAGSNLALMVPLLASGAGTLDATSSDPCVVTADVSGTTLTLTGVVAGTATITVTAGDGGFITFRATVRPPRRPDWALPRTVPEDARIAACAASDVLDHVFTDGALQSALLLVDGTVIAERYADGYDHASLGTSWSVAKSFYSAAIGVAIDRGHIASLDQRASDFFTEWTATDKEDITVRDLLEMRAGLPNPNIFVEYDQTTFALAQDQVAARGTTFRYSNATSQTLRAAHPAGHRHGRPRLAGIDDPRTDRHRSKRDRHVAGPHRYPAADVLLPRHATGRFRALRRALRQRRRVGWRDPDRRGLRAHEPVIAKRVLRLAVVGDECELLRRHRAADRRERRARARRTAHLRVAGRQRRTRGADALRIRPKPGLRLEPRQLPEHVRGAQFVPGLAACRRSQLQRTHAARAAGRVALTRLLGLRPVGPCRSSKTGTLVCAASAAGPNLAQLGLERLTSAPVKPSLMTVDTRD